MIFLLVSAHNSDLPLPSLLDEQDSISASLRPLRERLILEFEPIAKASHSKIVNFFLEKAGEIEIFHYSGHANGKSLGIEAGGHVRGMSELLGLEKDTPGKRAPKLVFLNGCGTFGQVAILHKVGVEGVIATNFKVIDDQAYVFAKTFYEKWVQEGVSLSKAFESASAALHGLTQFVDLEIETAHRYLDFEVEETSEKAAWGLYINPALNEQAENDFKNWQINPREALAPLVLKNLSQISRDSIDKLVTAYQEYVQKKGGIISDAEPFLALIRNFPWVIGTHLRRLFALEPGAKTPPNNLDRLKEIDRAYVEFLRFLNNILLSMLWDQQETLKKLDKPILPQPIVDPVEASKVDYLSNIRNYLAMLEGINGDHLGLEKSIRRYLEFIDGSSKLFDNHKLMAELHLALYDPSPERLDTFLSNRNQTREDLNSLCLESEAIYVSFLEQAFFLTKYRLLSIWSISVGKVKLQDTKEPYDYKIIDLHGAYGPTQLFNTRKRRHGDSFCVIMVNRKQNDGVSVESILNLSPFYIDRNAFLSSQQNSAYPSIFVLQHHLGENTFIYSNIDLDPSFHYQYETNIELTITTTGAKIPEYLNISPPEKQKFALIHQQLIRLQNDFKANDRKSI